MGFRLTKEDQWSEGCDYCYNIYRFEWKTDMPRYGTHYVCITSRNNWNFQIERSFSGYETGVEGWARYTCFEGGMSSDSPLQDLDTILRCTGVLNDIKEPNILMKN